MKIGYQLYAAEGPKALEALRDNGFYVFADLKLHDIPNTVEHGARNLAKLGVSFVNFHAAGGVDMFAPASKVCTTAQPTRESRFRSRLRSPC